MKQGGRCAKPASSRSLPSSLHSSLLRASPPSHGPAFRPHLTTILHACSRGAQVRFDLLLFTRPDLAALLPLLPWCFYNPNVARKNQDWLEWLPRDLAEAALHRVHAEYYACQLPNLTSMGDYAEVAALHGTRLVSDQALRVIHIARDNQPHFPHKKVLPSITTLRVLQHRCECPHSR